VLYISIDTYSSSHGSVLLKAARANGLEAKALKLAESGSISMMAIAPPDGSTRYASLNILADAAAGSSWVTRLTVTRSTSPGPNVELSPAACRKETGKE